MKRPYALLACLLSTSAVLVALVSPAGAAGTASSSRVVKIQLRHTSLGKILVDSSGFTLYRFTKDSGRTNSCVKTSQCPGTWPAFAPSGTPTAGPGVKASLISSIKLPNGSRQITYEVVPFAVEVRGGGRGVMVTR